MTTGEIHDLSTDDEKSEIVAQLGSVISSSGDDSREIKRRLRLGRAEKKIRRGHQGQDASSETKDVSSTPSPSHHYGQTCKLDSEESGRKNHDSFEICGWRRASWRLWTSRQMNGWVLEQITPETSLQAQMTTPELSYSGTSREGQGS